MSGPDFTRWNRAGLPRVQYVNANAVTHLDALRTEFENRFPEWSKLPAGPETGETELIWLERLEKQYRLQRQDWAWETSRSFARALHILTSYVDAYANEGFIGTATQWEHIRRLAAMVGYTPKPASSAETRLALAAHGEARIEAGFQVKHTPIDGSPPVVFETIEDISVDEKLNAVRLISWNYNSSFFKNVFAPISTSSWLAPKDTSIVKGDIAILRDIESSTAETVRITAFDPVSRRIAIEPVVKPSLLANTLRVGNAVLQFYKPKYLSPLLNGSGVVWLGPNHNYVKGDVAVWQDSGGVTKFSRIAEVSSRSVLIESDVNSTLPQPGAKIAQAKILARAQFEANNNSWKIARSSVSATAQFALAPNQGHAAGTMVALPSDPSIPVALPANPNANAVWVSDYVNAEKTIVTVPLASNKLMFEGRSPVLANNEWVIVTGENVVAAAQVKNLGMSDGSFTIEMHSDLAGPRIQSVLHDLNLVIRPEGHNRDPNPVQSLVLDVGNEASYLRVGRKLILEEESSNVQAIIAEIAEVDVIAGNIVIAADTIALSAFTRGGLIIRGNAVEACHGETQPLKTLGSGNAEINGQEFVLDFADISSIRNSTLPSGQKSAITLECDGQIYEQVDTLRDCAPEQPAYTIRVKDNGTLTLRFGNGQHGRRLPTGSNNVKALIKRGVGLSGNVPPHALDKISSPHAAVAKFWQPIAASGGDKREELTQIASTAPARLKAMGRAIGVSDYETMASQFGGVWHAVAFERQNLSRSRNTVEVIVVPAGGGALGSLAEDVASYLRVNGLPQTNIKVGPYVDMPIILDVKLRVQANQYDPGQAAADARIALRDVLHLRQRKPGQTLYRSEILQVLEHVRGVMNADVKLFPNFEPAALQVKRGDNGGIWAIFPHQNQVFHAGNTSQISIVTEEADI